MAMQFPDIVLLDSLNAGLTALRQNYTTVTVTNGQPESETMLYKFFGSSTLNRYGFFTQAKSLLLTSPERDGSKHLEVVLSYDANSWKGELVAFITMPSATPINNSLGLGEGNLPELTSGGEWRKQFVRRKSATYQLVIMSINKNETILLYYLFDLLIMALHEHLELGGLSKLSYGGGDLNFRNELPDRVFAKAITFNFEYDSVSTEFDLQTIVDEINVVLQLVDDES